MGRIRTIKPEILLDRKAAQLTDDAWRLWVSMWVIADDFGRLPADAALLAGQVFWAKPNPFDAASRALASLRESSMVAFYEVRGEPYAQILGWKRHQKIDRPSGPKFPPPDEVVALQTSMILASPREPSRTLDPDHDRDHDHDRSGSVPGSSLQEIENASGERERVAAPAPPVLELLAQELEEQLAPHRSIKPRKSRAAPAGEASVKPDTKPKVVTAPPPEEAFTLAHLLMLNVTGNHPESRLAKMAERQREHTALIWAGVIDRMHRLDGHAYPTIQKMIVWVSRHRYWQTVVLGADVLRAKWDKIIAEASRDSTRPAARPGPTAQSLATLERLEAEEREKQQP